MERIKKLIVVILCVGMISSLNISFIYASQSNGYHPLNIKIESPDVPKTVTPKRNADHWIHITVPQNLDR